MEANNNFNMEPHQNISTGNTEFKIIENLHNEHNQYDNMLPPHIFNTNEIDYNKDRLSPWNEDNRIKLKMEFSKIKKTIQQETRRQIKTHRSEHRNKIFGYTNFQRFYKKNPKDEQNKEQETSEQHSQLIEPKDKLEKLNKNQTVYIKKSKAEFEKQSQIKLPSAYNTTTLQLKTPDIILQTQQKKRMKKPIPAKTSKKQIVETISYKEIEQALLNRPMLTSRFHFFCKKIQNNRSTKNHLLEGTLYEPQKLKVINFPLKLESHSSDSRQNLQKERELKSTKSNFNRNFFMRTKMKQQAANDDQSLKEYSTGEKNIGQDVTATAGESINKFYSKKRKSRIFSLVLRI